MRRIFLGIIAGGAVCNLGFMALTRGLAQVWPAYAAHGRTYLEQRVFTFTPPMAVCTLILWIVAAFAAGLVAMKIAYVWRAVQVLAALIVAYAAVVHLILHWPRFPWWYNLAVVLQMGPAVLLGARSVRRVRVGHTDGRSTPLSAAMG